MKKYSITVRDKRCKGNMKTVSKLFIDINEAIEWANSLNNKAVNYMIEKDISLGETRRVKI